jgi:hypothetical protein
LFRAEAEDNLAERPAMASLKDLKGEAALSICESLLLCLTELKIITPDDAIGVVVDAATAHSNAANEGAAPETNRAIASLISELCKPLERL